jgi:hypothetical protein
MLLKSVGWIRSHLSVGDINFCNTSPDTKHFFHLKKDLALKANACYKPLRGKYTVLLDRYSFVN